MIAEGALKMHDARPAGDCGLCVVRAGKLCAAFAFARTAARIVGDEPLVRSKADFRTV